MKSIFLIILLSIASFVCSDANAQSLARMGGTRGNDMYGFAGSGKVYGVRPKQRNLTGVSRQRQAFPVRRFRESTITGVQKTTRIYSQGFGRAMFNRGAGARRFF